MGILCRPSGRETASPLLTVIIIITTIAFLLRQRKAASLLAASLPRAHDPARTRQMPETIIRGKQGASAWDEQSSAHKAMRDFNPGGFPVQQALMRKP
jgi:hypothetical protein